MVRSSYYFIVRCMFHLAHLAQMPDTVAHNHSTEKQKSQEEDVQPEEINGKIVCSDLRNPQKKLYATVWRCRKSIGHSHKTKNNGATTTVKLKVACPNTPSKVRAVGTRRFVGVKKNERPKTENN